MLMLIWKQNMPKWIFRIVIDGDDECGGGSGGSDCDGDDNKRYSKQFMYDTQNNGK